VRPDLGDFIAEKTKIPVAPTPKEFIYRPLRPDYLAIPELFENFLTRTYSTLNQDPVQKKVWKETIPEIANSFEFVMHSLLAFSALHLAYLHPEERSHYEFLALIHHQTSIHIAGPILLNVTVENCSALYIFSIVTALITVASSPEPGDFLIRESGIAPWIEMFRGIRAIMMSSREALLSGPLKLMILNGLQRIQSRESEDLHKAKATEPLTGEQELLILQMQIETSTDPESLGIYAGAIEALRKSYSAYYLHDYNSGTTDAFIWVYYISNEYISLLRNQTQESLCIFAFFCVLLHQKNSPWWCEGSSIYLMTQIESVLNEKHRHWIRWPLEQVLYSPSMS
jgi:hypothetical protein